MRFLPSEDIQKFQKKNVKDTCLPTADISSIHSISLNSNSRNNRGRNMECSFMHEITGKMQSIFLVESGEERKNLLRFGQHGWDKLIADIIHWRNCCNWQLLCIFVLLLLFFLYSFGYFMSFLEIINKWRSNKCRLFKLPKECAGMKKYNQHYIDLAPQDIPIHWVLIGYA